MTYTLDNKNGFARNDTRISQSGSGIAVSARPVNEETFEHRRGRKAGEALPFNGLLTNKLLTDLPGEDFTRLLPYLEPVFLSCGEDLYGLDDGVHFVYFPETAVISHLYVAEDGSTTEAAMIGKDGMTGLSTIFSAPQPSYWTQVTIAGSALRIKAEVVKREFARGEALQTSLLGYAGARIAQLSQRAVCNGRHSVEERLCNWLLMIQDRAADEQLSLTHEQMARHLGVRRAGVTSAANALRDKQIISYSRARIRILDRGLLEAAACECYRALNQEM